MKNKLIVNKIFQYKFLFKRSKKLRLVFQELQLRFIFLAELLNKVFKVYMYINSVLIRYFVSYER